MAEHTVRTHVVIPKELLDAVDRLVGRRKRSAFLTEALAEKVAHEELGRALASSVGILTAEDYPEWATPEKTSEWVRELRALDDDIDRQCADQ
jgi:metal-responsive CopG/Arc/MetJ family transcriptional regulator